MALVTGSTRGSGEAICRHLAATGASIVIAGQAVEDGKEAVSAVHNDGHRSTFVQQDIATGDATPNDRGLVTDAFDRPISLIDDVAPREFAAPGIDFDQLVTRLGAERFEQIIHFEPLGTVRADRDALLPAIRNAGGGSAVTISSASPVREPPGMPAHLATEGALNALTRQPTTDRRAFCDSRDALVAGLVMSRTTSLMHEQNTERPCGSRFSPRIMENVAAATPLVAHTEAECITVALCGRRWSAAKMNVPAIAAAPLVVRLRTPDSQRSRDADSRYNHV